MKQITLFLMGAALLLASLPGCGAQETLPEATVASASQPGQAGEAPSQQTPESAAEEEPVGEESGTAKPVDNEWESGDPGRHGMDSERLAEIRKRFAGSQMLAAVIVKDGVIIEELYKDNYDADSLFPMHSVTKSVMGTAIGIAIEQGILAGVDVRLADFYPQLKDPDNAGKEDITIGHLLAHTSGLNEGSADQSFTDHVESENWVEHFLSRPMASEPGTTFFYSTAGSHLLSAVLEQAAGKSTEEFTVEHLFGPLGIENFYWGTDPQGITDGGNGLSMTVRDAAKLGQLYLEDGNWRGRQLIPQEWVRKSTSAHAPGEADKGQYGYQWWIKPFGGYDTFYALGYAGQFVFVVPELEVVVSIASKSVWSEYTGQVCISDIIAACN